MRVPDIFMSNGKTSNGIVASMTDSFPACKGTAAASVISNCSSHTLPVAAKISPNPISVILIRQLVSDWKDVSMSNFVVFGGLSGKSSNCKTSVCSKLVSGSLILIISCSWSSMIIAVFETALYHGVPDAARTSFRGACLCTERR